MLRRYGRRLGGRRNRRHSLRDRRCRRRGGRRFGSSPYLGGDRNGLGRRFRLLREWLDDIPVLGCRRRGRIGTRHQGKGQGREAGRSVLGTAARYLGGGLAIELLPDLRQLVCQAVGPLHFSFEGLLAFGSESLGHFGRFHHRRGERLHERVGPSIRRIWRQSGERGNRRVRDGRELRGERQRRRCRRIVGRARFLRLEGRTVRTVTRNRRGRCVRLRRDG